MRFIRSLNLFDVVVLIVVPFAIVLPPRTMYAFDAARGSDADRIALATAEARVRAHPEDGAAAAETARRLTATGHLDWAVEVSAEASRQTQGRPSRWRALLATSIAYADRLEAKEALAWASLALDECHAVGAAACPSWEEVKVDLYVNHLDAGVRSGINPKRDPEGFRAAGEEGIRTIRVRDPRKPSTP